MSFISKKALMFKIRSKFNKSVKPNLQLLENCEDFRLWSMNAFERHQALLDEINGVQYEGDEQEVHPITTKDLTQEYAGKIAEYQEVNQLLTAENKRMIELLQKCEEEKLELSQINNELNNVRKRLTDQRKSIDIEQNCRELLEKSQKDYEARINELKDELRSKANVEARMGDLSAMERELEDIKNRYDSDQHEMARLRDELGATRQQCQNEYIDQLASTEKQLADLKRESEMFQNVLKEKEEFERNVKKSLAQEESEKKLLKSQMDAAQKAFESEKTAWAQKHAQVVDKMKKTHEDLAETLNDAKRLRNELRKSQIESEACRKMWDDLKQEHEKNLKEMEKRACRIKQLEEKIKNYSDDLLKAQEEVKKMAGERESIAEEHKDMFAKIECEHEKELKLIRAQEGNQKKLQVELEALREKLNALNKERDEMKTLADQKTVLANDREKELKELTDRMKKLEKVNASLRESNEYLEQDKKEMTQKLKLFQEERNTDQGENLQTRSDSHILGKTNQPDCKDCMCKVLVENNVQKMGDGGVDIKDVLAKALVDGLQSLAFNEIAQLHQHMQNALGQLLEYGKIDLKTGAPVVLSYLHKTNEPQKEVILGKVEDVEKVLNCQEKSLKKDVSCLQRGVTATKHRVDRLKEKAQKTPQVNPIKKKT